MEVAARFSALSRRFAEKPLTDFIIREFPQVEGLWVEAYGSSPIVHARLAGISEKVPLNIVSSAVNKVVAVLSCIAANPRCTVFIDEIENGIHYSKLEAFWRGLLELSRTYDAQVFASTHSWECLQAAARVAAEAEEDFSITHLGRDGVRQSSGSKFVSAVEEEIEVR